MIKPANLTINLRRLRYFVVLAQELHFGRAAARLHLAQPALTQNVQQLELDLGVALFTRSSRRVELSDGGRILLEEAQRLLTQASSLEERMRAFAEGRYGHLRLNYARSMTGGLASSIVDALRAAAPALQLEINSQYTAKSVEDLLERRLDAAFVRTPLDLDETFQQKVQIMQLGSEPLLVALPRSHPLSRRRRIQVAELRDEPIVTGSPQRAPGFYRSMFSQIWGERVPRIVMTEPDEEHMLLAVSAGVGLTILTQSRANLVQMSGVVVRPFANPEPHAELALIWVGNAKNAALARLLEIASAFSAAGRAPPSDMTDKRRILI